MQHDAQLQWSRQFFLRGLALIYLIAFVSLGIQINGLVGPNGILPVVQASWLLPTLCGAGGLLAVVSFIGLVPAVGFILLWLLYLLLFQLGQEFLSFQWDILLLEAGFLAIFWSPLTLFLRSTGGNPSPIILWLLRWLLFRILFSSGVVKLMSGDPVWWDLTALSFHYETQPLPTWVGWYAHQLPIWFQRLSCAVMFFVELVVPFFILMGRRLRQVAFWLIITFQLLIGLTGNYTFFNLLTMLLCFSLFPFASVPAITSRDHDHEAGRGTTRAPGREWPRIVIIPVALLLGLLSLLELPRRFVQVDWPTPLAKLHQLLAPFRLVNSYGLFAVMTRPRNEVILEGSADGQSWQEYEFRWKPGDLKTPPRFVEPHQPRLDWQMWFVALGGKRELRWFKNFVLRLLQGDPEVTALLRNNPFMDAPPKQIRGLLYEYHFTDPETREETGQWWRRELKGVFFKPVALP